MNNPLYCPLTLGILRLKQAVFLYKITPRQQLFYICGLIFVVLRIEKLAADKA